MADYQAEFDRCMARLVAGVTAIAREAAAAALGRGGGRKRTRRELGATRARVRAFIAKRPGLRVEEINEQLGTTTRELALPLKTLIREGAIRTEGARRATTYFPAA